MTENFSETHQIMTFRIFNFQKITSNASTEKQTETAKRSDKNCAKQ